MEPENECPICFDIAKQPLWSCPVCKKNICGICAANSLWATGGCCPMCKSKHPLHTNSQRDSHPLAYYNRRRLIRRVIRPPPRPPSTPPPPHLRQTIPSPPPRPLFLTPQPRSPIATTSLRAIVCERLPWSSVTVTAMIHQALMIEVSDSAQRLQTWILQSNSTWRLESDETESNEECRAIIVGTDLQSPVHLIILGSLEEFSPLIISNLKDALNNSITIGSTSD